MHSLLSLIVILGAVSLAAEQALDQPAGLTRLDVVYKNTNQGALGLDLHYPAPPRDGVSYPLVIFTHGGGWVAGNKSIGDRGVRFLGVRALTAAGFCVASVDYRLCTPDGNIMVRDCVTDAKDGLRFLAKNAERYSIDPQRVFTFGDSAGGQLAQMLLLSPPEAFPGDPALMDATYQLIAGVSWYGPCDFEKTELYIPPGEKAVRDRFGSRIIKPTADEKMRLAAYREVSPVGYLRPESPPLLMMQGDNDPTIPVHHARYMKERADSLNAPVELFIVENCGHNWRAMGGVLRPSLEEVIAKTADFMKQHLERLSKR